MIKIIGVERNGGTFQNDNGENVAFDNIIFHIVANTNRKVKGLSTGTCKLAFKKLLDVAGTEDFESLVNKEVTMDYIPNGKNLELVSIIVIPPVAVTDKPAK